MQHWQRVNSQANWILGVTVPVVAFSADADGVSNLAEFLANTDPTRVESHLRVTDVQASTNGLVTLTWQSRQDGCAVERQCSVFRAASLAAGTNAWTCLASNLPPAGEVTSFTDDRSSAAAAAANSFRVGIAGPPSPR